MKGKISFLIGVAGMISLLFINDQKLRDTILKIALGLIIASVIELLTFLYENKKRWHQWKTQIFKRNKPVRVTVAYLFRIEHNGRYALIKRHKNDRPGYQPIGGAFKYFKDECRDKFDDLGVEPCNKIERDEDTVNDLRVIVKKRKNLLKFLKWFESRKNRELDPYREFSEELIKPEFLSSKVFEYFKYVFIGKHVEGVLKSPAYLEDEVRYAEIYELCTESDNQKQEIQNLVNYYPEIIFATPEEIRNGSTKDGQRILPHTFKILPK